MKLDIEQTEFAAAVRAYAQEQIRPVIGDFYERGEFPIELVRGLGKLGVLGVTLPEEHGGAGMGLFMLGLALEEIARVDASVAVTVEASVTLGAEAIAKFGTPAQQAKWLPNLAAGQGLVAFALTEPGGGTDAGHTDTKARLEDGEWVVDGAKCFITNAGTAMTDLVIATAQTGPGEVSCIAVEPGTPGLEIGPEYSKVGWRASDTRPVYFDNCRVPEANLIGQRGRGFVQFLELLDSGRVAIAALATGSAQGCLDEALAHAKERQAFGRPIGENQAIAFMLADMKLRAHTSRLAWQDAALKAEAGEPFGTDAALAKLHASLAAVDNARDATQIFGGYGFMNETPVARAWRDAKVLEIGEGTNEVQRMLIARSLGL
ncbi:acyl-CoA dehydrogenase family protein [Glycomyces artemisiae]|uniref:Butyryl-CoA dehydrogenase n=1 Tax=Glycomyces artemisiae TaxID=1076443 RepID=A0A2T0UMK3_9ACTN|nr:acyl-CoA dehydrogenase family protein [Glycomyces artemisiae]PRY59159.1 butyryl-CoA dehydrogenase [Glycomyces artemisiae]